MKVVFAGGLKCDNILSHYTFRVQKQLIERGVIKGYNCPAMCLLKDLFLLMVAVCSGSGTGLHCDATAAQNILLCGSSVSMKLNKTFMVLRPPTFPATTSPI